MEHLLCFSSKKSFFCALKGRGICGTLWKGETKGDPQGIKRSTKKVWMLGFRLLWKVLWKTLLENHLATGRLKEWACHSPWKLREVEKRKAVELEKTVWMNPANRDSPRYTSAVRVRIGQGDKREGDDSQRKEGCARLRQRPFPMPRWFSGRTTTLRVANGESSLFSYAKAHYPGLELRVNWAPHYALLRAQHPVNRK